MNNDLPLEVDDKHELRCFCARKPLLAIYGRDIKNRVFVHVRIFKQSRVYHESYHFSGEVYVMCRDCFRWHRVVFVNESDALRFDQTECPDPSASRTTQPTH